MTVIIESQSDLDKYEVKPTSDKWTTCCDRAIKGPVYDGPMYYFPAHADVVFCIPIRSVNLFIAGGVVRFEGAGRVDDSLIYNRLIEEF